MDNLSIIEEYYNKYITDLRKWCPEGILSVDLQMLHNYDLLQYNPNSQQDEDHLTRYFHVVETPEKFTLINSQFVVWIVPDNVEGNPTTYALIALNEADGPVLETVFQANGVYNTSGLVLRILEKILIDIQEVEELLTRYKTA